MIVQIRAQSVLKQHQSNQRERTPSIADKQIELEEIIEKFKINLQEAKYQNKKRNRSKNNFTKFSNKIQVLISENEALQKEQDSLVEIQAKLINESRKREQELRKQVNHTAKFNEYLFFILASDRYK